MGAGTESAVEIGLAVPGDRPRRLRRHHQQGRPVHTYRGPNGVETGSRGNQWVPEPNPPSKLAQQYPVIVIGVFGVTINKADKSTLIEAKMA